MARSSVFNVDPDFCSVCGTFLSIDTKGGVLECDVCGFTMNLLDERYKQVGMLTLAKNVTGPAHNVDLVQSYGPVIARTCRNCGNPEMAYKTQQTRSADEPETVFYTCKKCWANEIENI